MYHKLSDPPPPPDPRITPKAIKNIDPGKPSLHFTPPPADSSDMMLVYLITGIGIGIALTLLVLAVFK